MHGLQKMEKRAKLQLRLNGLKRIIDNLRKKPRSLKNAKKIRIVRQFGYWTKQLG